MNQERASRTHEASVIRGVVALSMITASSGCAATARFGEAGFCAPPSQRLVAFDADPPPPADAPRVERIAALLGLRDALATTRAGEPAPVEARLRALDRIVLARIAIASIAAELDCEGERAEQAAAYLEGREDRTQRVLTIASIVTGAATGVASAVLSSTEASSRAEIGVAIGGGAVGAGLGLASLWVHPTMDYRHPRNLLAEVWTGPRASSVYPPIVWAYLTHPEFPTTGGSSIRENVLRRWRDFGALDGDTTILFGAGGTYDHEALRARAGMLDQVRAEVSLLDQEVAELGAVLLARE